MSRIRLLTALLSASCIISASALAADAVTVRASNKDDYTRIVLEWPSAPSYVTNKTSSAITLKFQQAGDFKISGAAPASLPRVTSYQASAKDVTIGFQGGQDVRHFEIGNKVIVDIRGPEKAPPPAQASIKEEPPKAEVVQKPEEATTAAVAETVAAVETSAKASAPVAADPAPVAGKDITITLTATKDIALASFTRGGQFWIVVDQPNFAVPQVAGAKMNFERINLPNATAFHTALPSGLNLHPQGNGKIWSFTNAKTKNTFLAQDFKRNIDNAKQMALLWPVAEAHQPIQLPDPLAGDTITVVPVASSVNAGAVQDFAELTSLASYAGLAVLPKSDDVKIEKTPGGILIHTTKGLAVSAKNEIAKPKQPEPTPVEDKKISEEKKVETSPADLPVTEAADKAVTDAAPAAKAKPSTVFDFSAAASKTLDEINQQKREIMLALPNKAPLDKAQDLLTLAKNELALGHGPEALGFLDLAGQFAPDLQTTPMFKGLDGLGAALTGDSERALRNFSDEGLKTIPDAGFLKPYALALVEDWKQAGDVLPADLKQLTAYPDPLRIPITLTLAEVALRAGKAKQADLILASILDDKKPLSLPNQSALQYLQGESQRQQGNTDAAVKIWEKLRNGRDDFYRAKAGLALTGLELEKKKITTAQAVDRLEGLRFAWRGDELETAINFMLGKAYVANKEPAKALTILQQAKNLSPNSDLGEQIATYMASTFKTLFTPEKIKTLDPIDATALYDEFSTLVPEGPEKQAIIRQLAERLVDADLLTRAASLLQGLLDSGALTAADRADVAMRQASIQLLDGKPAAALPTLDKAEAALNELPPADSEIRKRETVMLRAQALSDENKPNDAFASLDTLEQTADVLRMRADIAWTNSRWQEAADALEELAKTSEISPTRPVDDQQADIIMNWAVALYLADNKAVLANLREVYGNAMAASPRAGQFDVVTRPAQNGMLTNREAINAMMEETDIFKGFLTSFSAKSEAKPSSPAKTPAADTKPAANTPAPAQSAETVPPDQLPVSGEN